MLIDLIQRIINILDNLRELKIYTDGTKRYYPLLRKIYSDSGSKSFEYTFGTNDTGIYLVVACANGGAHYRNRGVYILNVGGKDFPSNCNGYNTLLTPKLGGGLTFAYDITTEKITVSSGFYASIDIYRLITII